MLTIYKASAGSGKTYTLAFEYIKLLLGIKDVDSGRYRLNDGPGRRTHRHRHILAITFTNKATEEMKSRIIDELALLAADLAPNCDSKYAPDLIKEFGCTRAQLRDAAHLALNELLFDYHHFNVSTIDSFFQTVLRAFAREVDRQGDYGIELSDKYAVRAGIGLMLDDLNFGNPPRRDRIVKWIRQYSIDIVENGGDTNLFNRNGHLISGLVDYVEKMGSEVFKQSADRVLQYLSDPSRIDNFCNNIDTRISSDHDALVKSGNALLDDFKALGFELEALQSPLRTLISKIADNDKIDIYKVRDSKNIQKILNWQPGDTSVYVKSHLPGQGKKNTQYPPESFSQRMKQWLEQAIRTLAFDKALAKIRKACPGLEFLGFTWHYINRFREENNLILLSDTHDLLQRIIGGCDAPFIYERIGVALHHFLIDEFQDTSHMQWRNLKPLVAESIATANDNLIIGDEKQAIYRFRNSDSSLLHHVVSDEDFPHDHILRGSQPGENTNYRSAADIVRFNNALFTRIAAAKHIDGYEATVQSIDSDKRNLGAYIRIFDTQGLPKINDMRPELEMMALDIIRQHEAGYRWSDIAVLTRKNEDEAGVIVNYLIKYHPEISIVSDEALLLRNSPAVKLIISMLKLVDKSYSARFDTSDDANEQYYASIGDIRLMISRFDYYRSEGHDAQQALDLALAEVEHGADPTKVVDNIIDIRQSHPANLVALVETIIEKKISPTRRLNEYAYIAAFQDEVINYCQTNNPSVHAFLLWWSQASNSLAITSGAGQDAVTVMTVHKAKGLQWPCVHIPFGDWAMERSSCNVWVSDETLKAIDPDCPPLISVELDQDSAIEGSPLREVALANNRAEMADNLNVTYVAYTRAKRELAIYFNSAGKNGMHQVIDSALRQPVAPDVDQDLCMDLAAHLVVNQEQGATGLKFVCGAPTTPSRTSSEETRPELAPGRYYATFRTDTATLTKVEDATADIGIIHDIRDDEPAPAADSDSEQRRTAAAIRGDHLHAIMAGIDSRDDIDSSVSHVCRRIKADADTEDAYRRIIHDAFASVSDLADRWFDSDARILREQSIYTPTGDAVYRPDRIVIAPDGSVDIIDYKFTSEPLRGHFSQVSNYMSLLSAMGFDSIRGYLWYPELNIVKSVNQTS